MAFGEGDRRLPEGFYSSSVSRSRERIIPTFGLVLPSQLDGNNLGIDMRRSPHMGRVFGLIDEIIGVPLKEMLAGLPSEKLRLMLSKGLLDIVLIPSALQAQGNNKILPGFVTGFGTLQGIASDVVAGALSIEDGLELGGAYVKGVANRAPRGDLLSYGIPSEAIKHDPELAAKILHILTSDFDVVYAAQLSDKEFQVGGTSMDELLQARRCLEMDYGIKAELLGIGVPIHTWFMKLVAMSMAEALDGKEIAEPSSTRIITSTSGQELGSATSIRESIETQPAEPVEWAVTQKTLKKMGVSQFASGIDGLKRVVKPHMTKNNLLLAAALATGALGLLMRAHRENRSK